MNSYLGALIECIRVINADDDIVFMQFDIYHQIDFKCVIHCGGIIAILYVHIEI